MGLDFTQFSWTYKKYTGIYGIAATTLEGKTWEAPGTIGSTTPNTGAFTTLAASGQFTSTVGIGTAPYVVTSTTRVANLNVATAGSADGSSTLEGKTWEAPGTIGSTTPNTGAFTMLSATGVLTLANSTRNYVISSDGTYRALELRGSTIEFNPNNSGITGIFSTTGLAVTGTLSATDTLTVTKDFNGSLIALLNNANGGNATYTNYQVTAGTATAAFNVTGSGTTTSGRYVQGHLLIDASGSIDSAIGGSIYSTLSTTGLAVSGIVSASSGSTANSLILNSTAASGTYAALQNSGTAFAFIGSAANLNAGALGDLALRSQGSALDFGLGGARYMQLTSTGLAVTGTGTFTSAGGAPIIISGTSTPSVMLGGSTSSFPAIRYDAASVVGCVLADQSVYCSIKATAFTLSSDQRFKINVETFTDSGTIIDGLRPIRYNEDATKPMHKLGRKGLIGFIAQDVYSIFPQAVTKGDDGEEIVNEWGVDYAQLGSPIVVAELKSLRARVAQLEAA